jgi:hypothetical protein
MKNGELIEISTDGYCAVCGDDERLYGHHLSYGPLVGEEVEITLPVCASCHKVIHNGTELKHYRPDHIPTDSQMRTLRESRRREKHPELNKMFRKSRTIVNEQMKDWRSRNREKLCAYQRERYHRNGGREKARIYRAKNRERYNAQARERRRLRRFEYTT